jgi:hypothetical protein
MAFSERVAASIALDSFGSFSYQEEKGQRRSSVSGN